MAEITKELGRIPVSRGDYQASTEYYKDNIVQYKRGSYQVVSESPIIGVPPTNDKNVVNPGWRLFAGIQGVDDVPTAGSDNLVKSGGVEKRLNYIQRNLEIPLKEYLATQGSAISVDDSLCSIPIKENEQFKIIVVDENGVLSSSSSIIIYAKKGAENILLQTNCVKNVEYTFTASDNFDGVGIYLSGSKVEASGKIYIKSYIVGENIIKKIEEERERAKTEENKINQEIQSFDNRYISIPTKEVNATTGTTINVVDSICDIVINNGEKFTVKVEDSNGILSQSKQIVLYARKNGDNILLQTNCEKNTEYNFIASDDFDGIAFYLGGSLVESNGKVYTVAYLSDYNLTKRVNSLDNKVYGKVVSKTYNISGGNALSDTLFVDIKEGEYIDFSYIDEQNLTRDMGVSFRDANDNVINSFAVIPNKNISFFASSDINKVVLYKAVSTTTEININISLGVPPENVCLDYTVNVTNGESKTQVVGAYFNKGDIISVLLNTGFCMRNTMVLYYIDMNNNAVLIGIPYIVHEFRYKLPCDIKAIKMYLSSQRFSEDGTYHLLVRKLNSQTVPTKVDVTVANNNLYEVISNIKDCSLYNPYEIILEEGTYTVSNEFSDALINSAHYDDDGFVGLSIPDGMTLVGKGKGKTTILCSIPTTFATNIRNQISTLNPKGNCNFIGISFVAENIRYAVHDDYYWSAQAEHKYVDCEFVSINGTGSSAYGTGINSESSIDFDNCFFHPYFSVHPSGGVSAKPAFVTMRNCESPEVVISDYDNAGVVVSKFTTSKINHITVANSGAQKNLLEGYNCPDTKINAPVGYIYSWSETSKFKNTNTIPIGTVLMADHTSTSNPKLMRYVVVGNSDGYVYMQNGGWFNCTYMGLSANAGDKIKISSSNVLEVVTSEETNYIGIVESINNELYFYIK